MAVISSGLRATTMNAIPKARSATARKPRTLVVAPVRASSVPAPDAAGDTAAGAPPYGTSSVRPSTSAPVVVGGVREGVPGPQSLTQPQLLWQPGRVSHVCPAGQPESPMVSVVQPLCAGLPPSLPTPWLPS